ALQRGIFENAWKTNGARTGTTTDFKVISEIPRCSGSQGWSTPKAPRNPWNLRRRKTSPGRATEPFSRKVSVALPGLEYISRRYQGLHSLRSFTPGYHYSAGFSKSP